MHDTLFCLHAIYHKEKSFLLPPYYNVMLCYILKISTVMSGAAHMVWPGNLGTAYVRLSDGGNSHYPMVSQL